MAQFKVPQNVQRADTIIGPLTMVQLIVAVVGGGLAYGIYLSLQSPVNIVVSVVIAAITAAFALIHVHDLSFGKYLSVMALYLLKPRLRVWEKGSGEIPLAEKVIQEKVVVQKKVARPTSEIPTVKFQDLHQLTNVLDNAGLADIDDAEDDELVLKSFQKPTKPFNK
jgi:hypothetical protein